MSPAILALALALQVLPAPASVQWEEVGTDQDGRNAIDPASVRRSGGLVRFTMRVLFHNPASFGGTHVMTMRLVFDCERRSFGVEAADGYDGNGRLTASREVTPAEVRYQPMTAVAGHEALRARVCGTGAA